MCEEQNKFDKMAKLNTSCVMCDESLSAAPEKDKSYNSKVNYKLSPLESKALCKVLRLPSFPFDFQFLQAFFCKDCKTYIKKSAVIFDQIESLNLHLTQIRSVMQNKLAKFATVLHSHSSGPTNLQEVNIRNKPDNDSSFRWEVRKQVFYCLQAIARNEVNLDFEGGGRASQGMPVRVQKGHNRTDCLGKTEKEMNSSLSPQSVNSELSQHDNHPSPDDPESDLSSQQGCPLTKAHTCEESSQGSHLSPQVVENQEPASNSETVNLQSVESNDIDHTEVGYDNIGSQRSPVSSENDNIQTSLAESHDEETNERLNSSSSISNNDDLEKFAGQSTPIEEREDNRKVDYDYGNVDKHCQTEEPADKLVEELREYERARATTRPMQRKLSITETEQEDCIPAWPNSNKTNDSRYEVVEVEDSDESDNHIDSPENKRIVHPQKNQIPMGEHQIVSPRENQVPMDGHQIVSPRENQVPMDEHQIFSPRENQVPADEQQKVSPRENQVPIDEQQKVSPRENQVPIDEHKIVSPCQNEVSPPHENEVVSPDETQIVSSHENQRASPPHAHEKQRASPPHAHENQRASPPHAHENQKASPPHENQVVSPQVNLVFAPQKYQGSSSHESQIVSPSNENQIVSPHENQVRSPHENLVQLRSPHENQVAAPQKNQVGSPHENLVVSSHKIQGSSPHENEKVSLQENHTQSCEDVSHFRKGINIQCSLDFSVLTECDNESEPVPSLLMSGIDYTLDETHNDTSSRMLTEIDFTAQGVPIESNKIFSAPSVIPNLSSEAATSSLSRMNLPPIMTVTSVNELNEVNAIPAELDFSEFAGTDEMSTSTVEVSTTGLPEIHFSHSFVNLQPHGIDMCSFSTPLIPMDPSSDMQVHMSTDDVSSSEIPHRIDRHNSDISKGMPELIPVSPAVESGSVSSESDMEPPKLLNEKLLENPKFLPEHIGEISSNHFPISTVASYVIPMCSNTTPSFLKEKEKNPRFSGMQTTFSLVSPISSIAFRQQSNTVSPIVSNDNAAKSSVIRFPFAQLIPPPKQCSSSYGVASSNYNPSTRPRPASIAKRLTSSDMAPSGVTKVGTVTDLPHISPISLPSQPKKGEIPAKESELGSSNAKPPSRAELPTRTKTFITKASLKSHPEPAKVYNDPKHTSAVGALTTPTEPLSFEFSFSEVLPVISKEGTNDVFPQPPTAKSNPVLTQGSSKSVGSKIIKPSVLPKKHSKPLVTKSTLPKVKPKAKGPVDDESDDEISIVAEYRHNPGPSIPMSYTRNIEMHKVRLQAKLGPESRGLKIVRHTPVCKRKFNEDLFTPDSRVQKINKVASGRRKNTIECVGSDTPPRGTSWENLEEYTDGPPAKKRSKSYRQYNARHSKSMSSNDSESNDSPSRGQIMTARVRSTNGSKETGQELSLSPVRNKSQPEDELGVSSVKNKYKRDRAVRTSSAKKMSKPGRDIVASSSKRMVSISGNESSSLAETGRENSPSKKKSKSNRESSASPSMPMSTVSTLSTRESIATFTNSQVENDQGRSDNDSIANKDSNLDRETSSSLSMSPLTRRENSASPTKSQLNSERESSISHAKKISKSDQGSSANPNKTASSDRGNVANSAGRDRESSASPNRNQPIPDRENSLPKNQARTDSEIDASPALTSNGESKASSIKKNVKTVGKKEDSSSLIRTDKSRSRRVNHMKIQRKLPDPDIVVLGKSNYLSDSSVSDNSETSSNLSPPITDEEFVPSPDISDIGNVQGSYKRALRTRKVIPKAKTPEKKKKEVRAKTYKKQKQSTPVAKNKAPEAKKIRQRTSVRNIGKKAAKKSALLSGPDTAATSKVAEIATSWTAAKIAGVTNRRILNLHLEKLNLNSLKGGPDGVLIDGSMVKVNHPSTQTESTSLEGTAINEDDGIPLNKSTDGDGVSVADGQANSVLNEKMQSKVEPKCHKKSHKKERPKSDLVNRIVMPISERQQIRKLLHPDLPSGPAVVEPSTNPINENPLLHDDLPIETPMVPRTTMKLPIKIKISKKRLSDGTESVEVTAPIKSVEVTAPIKSVEVTAPIKSVEVAASIKSVEVTAPIKSVEVTAPINSVEVPAPIKSVEVPAPIKPVEVTAPIKSVEVTAPIKSVDERAEEEAVETTTVDVTQKRRPSKSESRTIVETTFTKKEVGQTSSGRKVVRCSYE